MRFVSFPRAPRAEASICCKIGYSLAHAAVPGACLALLVGLSSAHAAHPTAVPAPSIGPATRVVTNDQTISIAEADSDAKIRYTTDGSDPSRSSSLYSAPFLSSGFGTVTVKAVAFAHGMESRIAEKTFRIAPSPSHVPGYDWKNVRIVGGGFVDGVYFHPGSRGLMYAKTDVGGAYRWSPEKGDTQWVPLQDFVGRFYSGFDLGVESLALDPNDPERLYLAVGEYVDSYGQNGAILISGNQGETFTPVPLPFKLGANDIGRNIGERLVVDPNNGRHLYLGTRLNGLQESLDGGHTWHPVTSFPVSGPSSDPEDPEVGVVFEDFLLGSGQAPNGNSKTVYIGVSSPGTGKYASLYVSNDGGATFAPVPGQPIGYYPNATSLDRANGILYLTYGLNTAPAARRTATTPAPTAQTAGKCGPTRCPARATPREAGATSRLRRPPRPAELMASARSLLIRTTRMS